MKSTIYKRIFHNLNKSVYKILFFLLIMIFILFISPRSTAMNFKSPHKNQKNTNDPIVWLLFSNDGIGYELGEDWDDHRSFGFYTGIFLLDNIHISLDYHGLTDRNLVPNKSLRIDELKFIAAYDIYSQNNQFGLLNISTGIGALFFGDLGGLYLQELFHKYFFYAPPRPIPVKYSPSQSLGFLCINLNVEKCFDHYLNFNLYSHITTDLTILMDTSLYYYFLGGFFSVAYGVGYQYDTFKDLTSAAASVYDSEKGIRFGSRVLLGNIYIERGVNLSTKTLFGSVGFSNNNYSHPEQTKEGSIRYDYYLGLAGLKMNHNIEKFRIQPEFLWPHLDFFIRLQNISYSQAQPLQMLRLHNATIGMDLYLLNRREFHWINAFTFLGGGFCKEREITHDLFHALPIKELTHPCFVAGLGLCFSLPDLIFNNKNIYYGIEITWSTRYSPVTESLYHNPDQALNAGFFITKN